MRRPTGGPNGRPPFRPTDQQRQTVQVLKANGNSEEVIARVIGVNVTTMRKHFKEELRYGFEHVRAIVGAAVVRSALSGNVAAQRYWLGAFGGPEWRQHTADADALPAPGGGVTQIIIKGGLPPVIQQTPQTVDETGAEVESPDLEPDNSDEC